MFSLRNFIKQGLLDAVGKMADYQIILNAGGWYNQNVLLQEDLAEIQEAINAKNAKQEQEKQIENILHFENTENMIEE